uniref:Major facilitator superfamily (MFS) profile domain-containing protein n=1 Tax=Bionectria ochroleuca TaxID=29856 RepID=A0A0B7JZC5_BIOOC
MSVELVPNTGMSSSAIRQLDRDNMESSDEQTINGNNNTQTFEKNVSDSENPNMGPPLVRDAPPAAPSPPPDGGLAAWLHVVGGFMIFFNTWGIMNTFGVFQTYYESGAFIHASSSAISWIGSVQAFIVMATGIVSGPVHDRGYFRALLLTGSFAIVFGHMMLSISKEYWQVVLSQGVCVGLGAGCLFTPTLSLLPTYFSRRLGLAMGLALVGSSLGGIIYPIVMYRLLDTLGFGWSVRVVAFIALGTLLLPCAVMRTRVKPARPRAFIDLTALKDTKYILFTLSCLLAFMGFSVIQFYLSFFAESRGLTGRDMSFYLVAVFNAGSCLGRVLPSALSDWLGPFNTIAPGTAVFGVVMFCMLAVKDEAGVVVLAVLGGFFSGVLIALPPVCYARLTEDKAVIGTRIGMGFSVIAFGMLAGGPGAGSILGGPDDQHWTSVWVFGGAVAVAAGFFFSVLAVWQYRAGKKTNSVA